ncbi:MAG: hypothetical protein ABSC18_08995 [Verrucomicrobiota bacterium]|jgi:hypothetical protein
MMAREELTELAVKLGYASLSETVIDRVYQRLSNHYEAQDPMATFVLVSAFFEDELKALRGDLRREAKAAAMEGAAEGAKLGAADGTKEGTHELCSTVLHLSNTMRDWLDKGYVAVTVNNKLLREMQDRIEKGKGVHLKVSEISLSPQMRRALLSEMADATVRAIMAEQMRPLRRANTAVLCLLIIICLCAFKWLIPDSVSERVFIAVYGSFGFGFGFMAGNAWGWKPGR